MTAATDSPVAQPGAPRPAPQRRLPGGGHRLLRPGRSRGAPRDPRGLAGARQRGEDAAWWSCSEGRGGERRPRLRHPQQVAAAEVPALSAFADRSRAFVQIQNGCDAFCSYCIIPYARGRSRSVPAGAGGRAGRRPGRRRLPGDRPHRYPHRRLRRSTWHRRPLCSPWCGGWINTLGKIRNITNQVKIDILARTIHSEINKRTFQKAIPSVEMIKSYLIQSKFVASDGEYAVLNVDKRELQDIEKEILNYFSAKKKISATFSEINAHLTKKGFSDASITQKVYHCSFLYVDKSGGRRNYKFILISNFTREYEITQEGVRYEKYRDRLSQLMGSTDTPREVKLRNEQAILRDWLFNGENATCCAICGRLFSTGSLVAAHKKKRSHCTDEERKDPNIVMPVCLFGCDTLYERGIISVENGGIVVCWQTGLQRAEIEYLEGLEHRKVDEQWLVGKSIQYFHKAITKN